MALAVILRSTHLSALLSISGSCKYHLTRQNSAQRATWLIIGRPKCVKDAEYLILRNILVHVHVTVTRIIHRCRPWMGLNILSISRHSCIMVIKQFSCDSVDVTEIVLVGK